MEDKREKRKVLVPIFNRAHYGRLRSVLRAVAAHPDLELQVMVGLSHAYGSFWKNIRHAQPNSHRESFLWYLRARARFLLKRVYPSLIKKDFLVQNIEREGFVVHSYLPFMLDGGATDTMAKVVGLGMVRITEELKRLRPDVVFVNADRFEMMAIALAAAYANIVIAHNEGGDVSGTIDESVRHAITKLAHIHFTSTEESRKRVIQMGENPEFVFNVGSPAIDNITSLNVGEGVGGFGDIDMQEKFLLVSHHPVTTETDAENERTMRAIIEVLDTLKLPVVFLGSNMDAGSKAIGRMVKAYLAREKAYPLFFAKHLVPDNYYRAIAGAACTVGNSSSFIREGAYFGTPSVLVGTRQQNRDRVGNVTEVAGEAAYIRDAVLAQLARERYKKDLYFGDGSSGKKIADILSGELPMPQKKFFTL